MYEPDVYYPDVPTHVYLDTQEKTFLLFLIQSLT